MHQRIQSKKYQSPKVKSKTKKGRNHVGTNLKIIYNVRYRMWMEVYLDDVNDEMDQIVLEEELYKLASQNDDPINS